MTQTLEQLSAAATQGECSLNECPPGLFMFNDTLGFKSEYTTTLENPRRYQCDAYVVESGEYFHGGARDTQERGALMVRPIRTGQLVGVQAVDRVVVGTVTNPSCMACEGTPKEGNNPCAVCGKRAQADDATVERVKDAIGTSLAYDIGMDVRAGSLTDDEKRKVARKAIAAMEGPKP